MTTPRAEIIVKAEGKLLVRHVLGPGEYVIGRDESACHIRVESEAVSRQHARLVIADGQFQIEDLGSTLGTFVNGEQVVQPTPLTSAQKVQLGNATLEFRFLPGTLDPKEALKGRHYQIGVAIAQGGMGAILSAEDRNIKRTVAMKVIRSDQSTTPESLERFIREAEVIGQLEHPNIVPIHELGVDDEGQVFYTMKLVKGVTFKSVLERIKKGDLATLAKYPLSQLLTVFQKVCDAMAFAHCKGIIHRDLKPENIMLGEFGEVLVMDWGLAKILDDGRDVLPRVSDGDEAAPDGRPAGRPYQGEEGFQELDVLPHDPSLTLEGTIMGTPSFMAPEQAEGKVSEMDQRTDIFALGGILYSLLTLRPPAIGMTMRELLDNIKSGYIVPPVFYNQPRPDAAGGTITLAHCPEGKVPEALSAVAMKAMATQREARYQTVEELQQDLAQYQGGFATSAEEAGAFRQLALFLKRNKTAGVVSVAALILLTSFFAFVVFSNQKLSQKIKQLKATAPAFYAQARTQADGGEFERALETLGSAIALAPDESKYRILRANLLQSTLKFPDAIQEYEAAEKLSPNDPILKDNLVLSRRLASANLKNPTNRNEVIFVLQTNAQQQARVAEALVLSRLVSQAAGDLQERNNKLLAGWRAQLESGGIPDKQIKTLAMVPDGTATLDLNSSSVSNLTCLAGIPLSVLSFGRTKVGSLEPLRGMPLRILYAAYTQVDDLRPLSGMPLEQLFIDGTPVRDLSPLKRMPLRTLSMCGLKITDCSPLKGMPLDDLIAGQITEVPISTLISVLKDLPLKSQLNLEHVTNLKDISFLKNKPLTNNLVLGDTKVSDLSPLAGKSFRYLDLAMTQVRDLSPLRRVQVETLFLFATPVADLAPLADTPVKELHLQGCVNLKDVSPLAHCTQLERLAIPFGVEGVETLRNHPKLQQITYSPGTPTPWDKVPPIAEFWKAHDARKGKKK